MSVDRYRTRCLGCGKWTRRSRCSVCRNERKREQTSKVGRFARRELRRARARRAGR